MNIRSPQAQRGITLVGLIFWAMLISSLAILAMRVLPTVNEYMTIKRTINAIATNGASTVPGIRAEFDKIKTVEYSISSISGQDLGVTKENDRIVISFAYAKEIDLFGPVALLIRYNGRSQ